MNGIWMLPVLAVGIFLAVKLTIFFNYLAYGQTAERMKKEESNREKKQIPKDTTPPK